MVALREPGCGKTPANSWMTWRSWFGMLVESGPSGTVWPINYEIYHRERFLFMKSSKFCPKNNESRCSNLLRSISLTNHKQSDTSQSAYYCKVSVL